jgi:hypothetical protein
MFHRQICLLILESVVKMHRLGLAILLILPTLSSAQNLDLGSWNILHLKYSYNDWWSGFGETQLRSLKLYNDFHYYEIKGGLTYKAHKSVKLTIGAGSYQTYKEGGDFVLPKNNDEFRVWPQVALSQSVGHMQIEQRYRTEMRFTSNGYRNRFRYRLGLLYPFGIEKNGYKPYQISASNEIFFTDNEPYFERNRVVLALNYKPSKITSLKIGYLHQFDYKINDETGRDFLQIGFFIELSRKNATDLAVDRDIKDN